MAPGHPQDELRADGVAVVPAEQDDLRPGMALDVRILAGHAAQR